MSNALPERMDTTMINVLKTIPDNVKANWRDQLAKRAFAYDSTVNKSNGFTRYYVMLGRESRISVLEKIYCYWEIKVYAVPEKKSRLTDFM